MTELSLNEVLAIAIEAHEGQTDKAGAPYIFHPIRVMNTLVGSNASTDTLMAALLHDTTEDSDHTLSSLLELGVPVDVVAAVGYLDRNLSKTHYKSRANTLEHLDEDEFYYHGIKNNYIALAVKLADIYDNLDGVRLALLPKETQNRLVKKYAKALRFLLS